MWKSKRNTQFVQADYLYKSTCWKGIVNNWILQSYQYTFWLHLGQRIFFPSRLDLYIWGCGVRVDFQGIMETLLKCITDLNVINGVNTHNPGFLQKCPISTFSSADRTKTVIVLPCVCPTSHNEHSHYVAAISMPFKVGYFLLENLKSQLHRDQRLVCLHASWWKI